MSDPRDPSGYSSSDLISMGFIATPRLAALVENTKPVDEIQVGAFDAIVIAGGQAPMATFEDAHTLHRKFSEFYEAGKIACALCHGVAILRYAKLSNGEYLTKGRTVTGFANVEEDFADNAVWNAGLLSRDKHVMPWRIEDELRKLGANYLQAGTSARFFHSRWQSHYRPAKLLWCRNRGNRDHSAWRMTCRSISCCRRTSVSSGSDSAKRRTSSSASCKARNMSSLRCSHSPPLTSRARISRSSRSRGCANGRRGRSDFFRSSCKRLASLRFHARS